ncbi:hypothetical protein FGB62_30g324 [Gracilaria domingensis]|nr:hypothetical protein FGB62_30g324 [Gracilaria domingensis]
MTNGGRTVGVWWLGALALVGRAAVGADWSGDGEAARWRGGESKYGGSGVRGGRYRSPTGRDGGEGCRRMYRGMEGERRGLGAV